MDCNEIFLPSIQIKFGTGNDANVVTFCFMTYFMTVSQQNISQFAVMQLCLLQACYIST